MGGQDIWDFQKGKWAMRKERSIWVVSEKGDQ